MVGCNRTQLANVRVQGLALATQARSASPGHPSTHLEQAKLQIELLCLERNTNRVTSSAPYHLSGSLTKLGFTCVYVATCQAGMYLP